MPRPHALFPVAVLVLAGTALAQTTGRPGITLSFATLGPSGGVDGRAYVPSMPSQVTVEPGDCGSRVTMTARARTGPVREVVFVLDAAGPQTVPIAAAGCPRASLTATMDDGTVLRDGEGRVELRELGDGGANRAAGTLLWTPRRGDAPWPMRGLVTVPHPAP